MFAAGDQVVHPLHGAGVIQNIVERKIGGSVEHYYALKLALDDVVLFIPVKTSDEIGLRPLCSQDEANKLLGCLASIDQDEDKSWNRRYRENMLRIRSGDITEVARVIKNLMRRASERNLSTGEKKMLGSAKRILVSELSLVLKQTPEDMEEILNQQFCL